VLIEIPGLGHQVMPTDLPVKLPDGLNQGIDTAAPFFGSDRTMTRLDADTTFRRYRSDFPFKRPWAVGLRHVSASEMAALPLRVQGEQTMWVLTVVGGDDTAMKCYGSAETGETYCQRISAVAEVDRHEQSNSSSNVRATWSDGLLRVTAQCDERPNVMVYSVTGSVVHSHTALRRCDEGWLAELHLSDLPPGSYFCRVTGNGWGETI
jgi:hypothetical protein